MKEKDINKLHQYAKDFAEQLNKMSIDLQQEVLNLTGKDAELFKIREEEIKTKVEQLNGEVFSLKDKINNL